MKYKNIVYSRNYKGNYFTSCQYLEDLYNNEIIRKRILANKIETYKFINLERNLK